MVSVGYEAFRNWRKGHFHREAALNGGVCRDAGAVGDSDGSDDGEPEAVSLLW